MTDGGDVGADAPAMNRAFAILRRPTPPRPEPTGVIVRVCLVCGKHSPGSAGRCDDCDGVLGAPIDRAFADEVHRRRVRVVRGRSVSSHIYFLWLAGSALGGFGAHNFYIRRFKQAWWQLGVMVASLVLFIVTVATFDLYSSLSLAGLVVSLGGQVLVRVWAYSDGIRIWRDAAGHTLS